ncbi:MAG: hypothetical protein JWP48_2877 [Actinoallomurus sp.]|jgi:hypothetical protein|nr:hypothetical protein [Actinoallomurus sp.]
MHHHTPLFSPNHIADLVAIGAFLCLLGAAFMISWQDGGDKLRSILSEIDNDQTSPDDHVPGPARRPSPPTKSGPDTPTEQRLAIMPTDPRRPDQSESEP